MACSKPSMRASIDGGAFTVENFADEVVRCASTLRSTRARKQNAWTDLLSHDIRKRFPRTCRDLNVAQPLKKAHAVTIVESWKLATEPYADYSLMDAGAQGDTAPEACRPVGGAATTQGGAANQPCEQAQLGDDGGNTVERQWEQHSDEGQQHTQQARADVNLAFTCI